MEERDSVIAESDKSREDYQEAKMRLAVLEERLSVAQASASRLSEELHSLQIEHDQTSAERDQLHDMVHSRSSDSVDKAAAKVVQASHEFEIARLRKERDDTLTELEVCQGRRNYAFTQHDKLVSESGSIRALSDQLRRERDEAVSQLADSLRDFDELKRRHNKLSKELIELNERNESTVAPSSTVAAAVRPGAILPHSSYDSAIDSEFGMQDWPMENVAVEIDCRSIETVAGIGLHLRHERTVDGEFLSVVAVEPGSAADGKLR